MDDRFTFNDEFTSKFKRIKVPLISTKEVSGGDSSGNGAQDGGGGEGGQAGGGPGDGNLPAEVEEERRHNVEAAIVRIMKARKTLSHNELVMETTRQLSTRFTPSPQVLDAPEILFLYFLVVKKCLLRQSYSKYAFLS